MTTTLKVGAAFPDPPFNGANGDGGLDISMMRAIGEVLGLTVEFVPYRAPTSTASSMRSMPATTTASPLERR
jgi:hypothetical protein